MKTQRRNVSFLIIVRNGIYCFAAGLLALLGATTIAVAQEWTFDPIVKAGYEYDDNAVLSIRTDEEIKISGYQVDVSASMEYATGVTNLSLIPRVRVRRYDDTEYDSTDGFLRLNYRHRGKANSFGIKVIYEQEGVRTAEQSGFDSEVDDPTDPTYDDTGVVQIGGDRQKIRVRPSWRYNFSNVSSIGISFDYFDVSYDFDEVFPDPFGPPLTDYNDAKAEILYSRGMSSVTTGIFMLTGRKLRNDVAINELDGFGAMVGFDRELSEKTKLRFLVGVDTADFSSDTLDSASDFVADISFVRTLETIRIFAQYKRTMTASSTRIPTIRDNYTLSFSRRLSEKISASLGARAYQTKALTGNSNIGRNFVSLTAGFGFRWSQTFAVELQINHTLIDRGGDFAESADANRAGIWFVYRPNYPDQR